MFGIGPLELVMIFVVALLVFGPKRVPELARTLGRGLAEFRRASNDLRQSLALDELQQDLRRDLRGQPTIHRPQDRPAQAGDDLPPSEKPSTVSAEAAATATSHPGELPLGDDHEHHDPIDEGAEGAATAAEEAPEARKAGTTTPADSPLGNIPVGGTSTDPKRG